MEIRGCSSNSFYYFIISNDIAIATALNVVANKRMKTYKKKHTKFINVKIRRLFLWQILQKSLYYQQK